MTQWNLTVSDKTDRIVRDYLASCGKDEEDLSQFVDETVRSRIFCDTVQSIHERNADADPNEIQRVVDEAVDWARAHRS